MVWLMNVCRLAIAVRVADVFFRFSNIHAAAHAINEQTRYTEKQTAIKAALALLSTLWFCRITGLACVHSSMHAEGPSTMEVA